MSEPHSDKSSVREPHTRNVNSSEPHTYSATVREPHTRNANMSEPQSPQLRYGCEAHSHSLLCYECGDG